MKCGSQKVSSSSSFVGPLCALQKGQKVVKRCHRCYLPVVIKNQYESLVSPLWSNFLFEISHVLHEKLTPCARMNLKVTVPLEALTYRPKNCEALHFVINKKAILLLTLPLILVLGTRSLSPRTHHALRCIKRLKI